MFKYWSSRGACVALVAAVTLGVAGTVPASAKAKRSHKSVNLTITVTPVVRLKGTKVQCFISKDGYDVSLTAKDYPSLGADGYFESAGNAEGKGSVTTTIPAGQAGGHANVKALVGGIQFYEDETVALSNPAALDAAVTAKVKKQTIKFNAFPISAVGMDVHATVTGTVKCK